MFIQVPESKLNVVNELLEQLQYIKKVKLTFDEKKKIITVVPEEGYTYEALKVEQVIKAFFAGYPLTKASRLLSDEYRFDVIDLKEYSHDPKKINRIKSRLIGKNGKFKKDIEDYTSVSLLITDRYIYILGPYDQMSIARNALERIIDGVEHQLVYKYIENAERSIMDYKLVKSKRDNQEQ
ncbi:RNA-processing protein [Sulfolobales archaeon HS-7]|nr:RNA-processing protein [Sulfolobales archaeon HS-7]